MHCTYPAGNDAGHRLIDCAVASHPAQHKIGNFGDVPQANLLAWYGKTT